MKLLFKVPHKCAVLPLQVGHCVECNVRARHRELTEKLLHDDPCILPEEQVEFQLLQRLIVETDFQNLKEENPLLDGRSGVMLVIEESFTGKLKIKTVKQGEVKAGNSIQSQEKEKTF